MPELKLYTIAQLRAWLEENQVVDGLSETIVAPQRAYAIIHNPYVKDADPVVAAIFVDGKNVAYTSAFPEMIEGKRYWWFSGLWCDPKHEGNGYGLIVIGSLVEVYGAEYCLDRWGAKATVEIFTYFGHKTVHMPRYVIGTKIDQTTHRGRIIYQARVLQKRIHEWFSKSPKVDYCLRYVPVVDKDTYNFIEANSERYYFHHTQEFLNWVLQYPFSASTPLIERVREKMPFSESETKRTQLYAVQVLRNDKLSGFYILKEREESLHVLYLYYEEGQKEQVFASIWEHMKRLSLMQCITENKDLADYLNKYLFFAKHRVENISYSYPLTKEQPANQIMQFADGDCFTA